MNEHYEIEVAEDLVTGARVEPKNEMPIEISAAICAGSILGLIVSWIIIKIIYTML